MKILKLYILLTIGFNWIAYSAPIAISPIIIKNVDIMTWPATISAPEVLDIYIEIMNSDPETKALLSQVNKKLKDHGIHHLKDIFNYCPGEKPINGATAMFSFSPDIAGHRITSIPGKSKDPWSEEALKRQQNAFSSKIFFTTFEEYLLVNERPEICIYKREYLFEGYDSVVHELVHLAYKDPFYFLEELISSRPFPNYAQASVLEKGGEFDAFKIGDGAALRLYKKYGIQGLSRDTHQFFNSEGNLTDEEGLKQYLIQVYTEYYSTNTLVRQLTGIKGQIIDQRIEILQTNVWPSIKGTSNQDLIEKLKEEIITLIRLKEAL